MRSEEELPEGGVGGDMPAGLAAAYRGFGWVKVGGAVVSGLSVFLMMLFIVWDVAARNLFGASVPGGFEIVQNYFMPLSVFPALGYVYASGILPRMDLLVPKLSSRAQQGTAYALLILELVIFALLIYFTWEYALSGLERRVSFMAGAELYPVWPLYFLVPLGFVMVWIETLFVFLRNLLAGGGGLAMNEVEHVVD